LAKTDRPHIHPHVVSEEKIRKLLVIASLVVFSLPALAQDTPTRLTPDVLTWKENPAFPKGVQIATLVGDPTQAGDAVVLRIKFPPTFKCYRTLIPIPRL
jgi:hypothetical protein